MIIDKRGFFRRLKESRNYKAEEEFYIRLQENPVYPFEDIGFGFYFLRVRSDRIIAGFTLILISVAVITMFTFIVGLFALPIGLFVAFFCFGFLTLYGNMSTRELVINREVGYLLRLHTNGKILTEHKVHNVYIRLQEKYDSVGMKWYYLILGGYQLDDIRLSRMTPNQSAMRAMGRRLARTIGINYFDFNNTTTRHVIFHYSTYSLKDTFEEHFALSDEDEEDEDALDAEEVAVLEIEQREEEEENMDAIRDQYEKYVSRQLLSRHFEETEDTVLDEIYYTAVIRAGETIQENVSREDKIEYLHQQLTKKK